MVKKRVLVTGASGYIGSRLCIYLNQSGYSVTALCHKSTPDNKVWIASVDRIVKGDLSNDNFLKEFSQEHFDIIIHLASLDHHKSQGPPTFVSSINVVPVWSLLDIFSKKGLDKFIYFSTIQVYDFPKMGLITENTQLNSKNPYALTHQLGEQICEYYNSNTEVNCNIIRLSNSYGSPVLSDLNCWWLVINDLCKSAYFQKQITLSSDGTPLRDFIHGWDVCAGVKSIIETKQWNVTYNLSSGKTYSILEIAQKIQSTFLERFNMKIPIILPEEKSKKISNAKNRYVIDNSLLKSLGFEVEWDLDRGVNELLDYFEKDL